jgi:hypothetical protein
MARYLEIAEQEMRKIRARREMEKTGERSKLPWAGYNGGNKFCCEKCGAHFDTSVGFATHEVRGCDYKNSIPKVAKTLPSCAKCGSFYLHKEADGSVTCMTCVDGPVQ